MFPNPGQNGKDCALCPLYASQQTYQGQVAVGIDTMDDEKDVWVSLSSCGHSFHCQCFQKYYNDERHYCPTPTCRRLVDDLGSSTVTILRVNALRPEDVQLVQFGNFRKWQDEMWHTANFYEQPSTRGRAKPSNPIGRQRPICSKPMLGATAVLLLILIIVLIVVLSK